jgi:hypothetical protein
MTWSMEERVKHLYCLIRQHSHEKMHKYSCGSCYKVQLSGHIIGLHFRFEVYGHSSKYGS